MAAHKMRHSETPREVSYEKRDLTLRHDRELSRLKQKQQDEWAALLDAHERQRHQLSDRALETSTDNNLSNSQVKLEETARLPAKSSTTARVQAGKPPSIAIRPSSSDAEVVVIVSGEEDTLTPISPAVNTPENGIEVGRLPPASHGTSGATDSQVQLIQHRRWAKVNTTQELKDNSRCKKSGTLFRGLSTVGKNKKESAELKAKASRLAGNKDGLQLRPDGSFRGISDATTPTPRSSSRRRPLQLDIPPESPPGVMREQMHNLTSILKEPPRIARDPSLLSLQMKKENGDFVSNILHNDRSESWASELGNVFQATGQDEYTEDDVQAKKTFVLKLKHKSQMCREIAHKELKETDSPFNTTGLKGSFAPPSISSSSNGRTDCGEQNRGSAHLPTPSQTTATTSKKTPLFKSPHKAARNFTSSAAAPKEPLDYDHSVASRFSTFSKDGTLSQGAKRKNVELMSDESDFAPSEPSSPKTKGRSTGPAPNLAQPEAKGQTEFNFKSLRTPPCKSGSRRRPLTPKAPAGKKQKFNRSTTPESPSVRAAFAMPLKKSNVLIARPRRAEPTRPSSYRLRVRGARAQAEQKIRDIAAGDEDWRTEEAIRKADEEEGRRKLMPNQDERNDIGGRFRSMSLTRPLARRNGRAVVSGDEDNDIGNGNEDRSVFGTEYWLLERMGGERVLGNGKGAHTAVGNESADELDISRLTGFTDGVISQFGAEHSDMEDV